MLQSAEMPIEGQLVYFGRRSAVTRTVIVTGVEMGEDASRIIRMVDAAPEIDQRLALEFPPPWSGIAGAEIAPDLRPPAPPRWTAITHGVAGTGDANRIDYRIADGGRQVPAV